jgi:hypothetical protein
MSRFDHDPFPQPESPEPLALPPELVAFLREHEYACLTQLTDQGTVYLCKARDADLETLSGPFPIQLDHELYRLPQAPVVRALLAVWDRPTTPLRLESFTNVRDSAQRDELAALTDQETALLLFYGDAARFRRAKRLALHQEQRTRLRHLLVAADQHAAGIPPQRYDFDAAKAAVIESQEVV